MDAEQQLSPIKQPKVPWWKLDAEAGLSNFDQGRYHGPRGWVLYVASSSQYSKGFKVTFIAVVVVVILALTVIMYLMQPNY